ncbi:MAG: TIGR03936 family radical SAM-associated protein [Candidatus Omnitrophica bacterium]|nr:TIGR03936 family radical SAM-associated protein [Candidatus Omnitrophota bacterium]
MYEISFGFTKKGAMKFISHLDLLRLLQRALRRSGLPLKMTEGFSPHPKLSIARALKLGLESDNEEARAVLKEAVDILQVQRLLNAQLPVGIKIVSIKGEQKNKDA